MDLKINKELSDYVNKFLKSEIDDFMSKDSECEFDYRLSIIRGTLDWVRLKTNK